MAVCFLWHQQGNIHGFGLNEQLTDQEGHLLTYFLTCIGIHTGLVEPASPVVLTTPRTEAHQARQLCVSCLHLAPREPVATHGLREWLMLSYQTFITFTNFSMLTLCCFINFCHLIKPLSSYQTSVIFSPLVIYSLFTLSSHLINAPTVHITNTTPFPVLSCARYLRQYTFRTHQPSLAIVPFCYGGDRGMAGGFFKKKRRIL